MTKHLVLSHIGSRWRIAISGPTQFGRLTEESSLWAVDGREQPPFFAGLEAFVDLGRSKVSRNHAGIFEEDGLYQIVDLNSLNGTKLNDVDINPNRSQPQPHLLQEGDKLSFPENVLFEVKYRNLGNAALLIAAGSDHHRAAEDDVFNLQNELLRRGYHVHTLSPEQATKQGVRDKIDEIAEIVTSDNQFFLYFHGHGGNAGIKLREQYLNPRELYQRLRQMRGRNAVIIDACNAGLFVDADNHEKIPEGTMVLAASGIDQRAREIEQPDGTYSGIFTAALVAYLQQHPEGFSLKDFYHSIKDRTELGNLVLQEPVMAGQTYTIPRQTSVVHLSRRLW